jgi:hypothetical protein
VDALLQGRAIAVVGSGLSSAAGAPSWERLLHGIAAEIQETRPDQLLRLAQALLGIAQGRYLDAAGVFKEILGDEFTSAVVRQVTTTRELCLDNAAVARAASGETVPSLFHPLGPIRKLDLQPSASHRILVQLPFRAIITTNYDLILELALSNSGRAEIGVYSWSYSALPKRIQDGQRFILKWHGDINHREDIILAREDYARALFGSTSRDALVGSFQSSKSFWIGYGHADPDLDLLLDKTRLDLGLAGGFAVAKTGDHLMEARLRHAQVFPSWLESYEDVPRYLRALAEATKTPLVFQVVLDVPWIGNAEAEALGHQLASALSKLEGTVSFWRARSGSVRLDFETDGNTLARLRDRLLAHEPELLMLLGQAGVSNFDGIAVIAPAPERVRRTAPKENRVFIISGRDERIRHEIMAFLRSLGLQPIGWGDAVFLIGKAAPSLSDVIELAFETAQAIIVVLTGDDEARLRESLQNRNDPSYELHYTAQPRMNVVFEAGFALGRYPERTILVQVGNLRPFSDLMERQIIRLTGAAAERVVLANRLQLAGCQIDLSGTDWLDAGDFSGAGV